MDNRQQINEGPKQTPEERKKLMLYRNICIAFFILYLLTFLTSDTERLPTIAETIRFALHLISRAGDLLKIICSVFEETQ